MSSSENEEQEEQQQQQQQQQLSEKHKKTITAVLNAIGLPAQKSLYNKAIEGFERMSADEQQGFMGEFDRILHTAGSKSTWLNKNTAELWFVEFMKQPYKEQLRLLKQVKQQPHAKDAYPNLRPPPSNNNNNNNNNNAAPPPQQQPAKDAYPNLRPPPQPSQDRIIKDDQNFQEGLNSTLDDIDIDMSDNSSNGKQVPEEVAKGVFQTFYEKASEIGTGMAMYALFLPALFSLMAEGFSIDPEDWFNAIGAEFDPETATDEQLDEIEDRANEMLQQRGSGHRVELVRSTRRRRRRRIVENITQLTQIEL